MENSLPKWHTLDIEYNDFGQFTAASPYRGGLWVHIYNSTEGFIYLGVNVEIEEDQQRTYWLKTIKPGDRLKFTYDGPSNDSSASIEKLCDHARTGEQYSVPEGVRLGFDAIFEGRDPVRLSHPEDGGFSLMLANVPLDHARVWVNAGSEKVSWNWQLEDLHEGASIEFRFVETNWCDPFPDVKFIVDTDKEVD